MLVYHFLPYVPHLGAVAEPKPYCTSLPKKGEKGIPFCAAPSLKEQNRQALGIPERALWVFFFDGPFEGEVFGRRV